MGRRPHHGGSGRRGKRPGPPLRGGRKPKRSKKFWQQRQTMMMTPMPAKESDEEKQVEESSEEEVENSYDQLLDAFGGRSNKDVAVESDTSEEEEDNDSACEESANSTSEEDDEEATDEDESEIEIEEEQEAANEERSNNDSEGDSDSNLKEEASESEEDNDESGESLLGTPKDPFVAKYELEIPSTLVDAVQERTYEQPQRFSWKALGNVLLTVPAWVPKREPKKTMITKVSLETPSKADASEEAIRTHQAKLVTNKLSVPKNVDFNTVCLKSQLLKNFDFSELNQLQRELFSIFNSYRDFSFCERTLENGESIRFAYVLHSVNHVLKTRAKILQNNSKIAKQQDVNSCNEEFRDQGLCRPKVLIVLPFRESAKRVVDIIIKLIFGDNHKGKVQNKIRFDEEFSQEEAQRRNKPDDFYDTFAGNIDDAFKLGLCVTKKSLKLYANFYSSDVIVASPLGLRMILGTENDKERDFDFLASIEVLIMDQMDVFPMQNWEHVTHLMAHMHLQPAQAHGVDFSRVRMWTLNHLSHLYRQTLMFSQVPMPEMNSIFTKSCHNFSGRVRVDNLVQEGSIGQVLTSVPMVFHRFQTSSAKDSIEDRFDYFCNKIMPDYKKDMMFHTCIFIPSYFDYVKVRNWFNKSDLDFLEVCEYTKDKKIAKARDLFFHSEVHFLLYTERIHFYRRLLLKGIRHLIFYQLPQYPNFFSEICNFMQIANQNRKGGSDGNMTCTVLYGKYDALRLSPVVGTDRAKHMMKAEKNVHMFVAGSKK